VKLELILAVAFGGALAAYPAGKISSRLRNILVVGAALFPAAALAGLYGVRTGNVFYSGFLGFPLILRIDTLSWLFAVTVSVLGALGAVFSLGYIREGEVSDFYYPNFLLVNTAMLGVVLAGDLVSFFIFWEVMSWAVFLLICHKRGRALAAGIKYIVMSLIGSGAIFIAILSLRSAAGTLVISRIAPALAGQPPGFLLWLLLLFSTAFGIKNALWPLHAWLPPAHSEAPSPFSAILSGVLVKIGTYGFILLFYVLIGRNAFLGLGRGWFSPSHLLSLAGGVTILVATFIALRQDDAKRLLAWSTIAQAGYIFVGLAFGTGLSVAGGLLHFLNHAVFKALLFLAVGTVEFRTGGVRDLNSLGGLSGRMPFTAAAAVVGVAGLIGVPLTGGFVSKWMLYQALILGRSPFLAFAALFGTWGTVLYGYKLIHHIFLGQLDRKYDGLRPAPFSMRLPMAVLALAVMVFGVFPGWPLTVIDNIIGHLGFDPLGVTAGGMISQSGALNTLNLLAAVLVSCLLAAAVLKAGRKTPRVGPEDNYAAGTVVPRDRYNFTVSFYDPLERMLKPYLRDFADEFGRKLTGRGRTFFGLVRRIYTGDVRDYVLYIVVFLALLILTQLGWRPWR